VDLQQVAARDDADQPTGVIDDWHPYDVFGFHPACGSQGTQWRNRHGWSRHHSRDYRGVTCLRLLTA
jgi:hypothetical protein